MFTLFVTLEVRPGQREVFLDAISTNAAASVREETGCLGFDVLELEGAANRFAFYETYTDREAFEVGHRKAPHFLAWRKVADQVVVPGSQVNTFGHALVTETSPVPAITSTGGSA